MSAVSGTATFSALNIDKAGTGYSLIASSTGLTSATTSVFNITAGAPAKLALITQPSNAVAGVAISPAVTLQVQDAAGNLTSSTASVSMAIGTNPGTSTLSGTATINAVAGVATFSTLSLNKASTGYTLSASSSGLTSATSSTFNISPAAAATLALSAPGAASAGAVVQVTVTAKDVFGNTATGYAGTVNFTSTDPNATLPGNIMLSSGTANVNVTFQNAGNQTVTGTDTVVSSISGTSSAIAVSESITLSATDTTAAVTGGDTGMYHFTRSGNGAAVAVNFSLNGSSTAIPAEYSLTGGSVSFNGSTGTAIIPASSTSVDVTLSALANASGIAKPSKTVSLDLASGTGYNIGSPATGTVAIAQNGFVVFNTSDSGQGTLRQAILNANAIAGTDTITFSDGTGGSTDFTSSPGNTITLTTSDLQIASSINIDGPGANLLSVSGNGSKRVFALSGAQTSRIRGLTITNGFAPSTSGVSNDGGSNLTILQCVVSGCVSNGVFAGGVLNGNTGTMAVVSCTISGNTGATSGGGISNSTVAGSFSLINSTVSGNSTTAAAAAGGGLSSANGGTVILRNSTITNNFAAAGTTAGGLYVASGTVSIGNCLIAGNQVNATTPDVGKGGGGSLTTLGGNVIGNGAGTFAAGLPNGSGDLVGSGASPLDPLISPLANNGGPTETHILLNGSPAINAGFNANLPADTFDLDNDANFVEALPVDQRGGVNLRVRGPAVDVGAVEAFAFEPVITAATTNEDTQTTSGLVISSNTADGGLTTHYQITNITAGTLYKNDGITVIANNAFITKAEGAAGLKFTPSLNLNNTTTALFGFTAQASVGNSVADLRGLTVARSISVTPVNDAPTVVSTGLADQTMIIGNTRSLALLPNFTDVDGDTLTYTVLTNTAPTKASAVINSGNVDLTALTAGATSITIQASDGAGGTVTDTFQVAVGTLNPTPLQIGTSGVLNRQNGLFDLTVNVTNTTPFPINGFRLRVNIAAYLAAYPSLRLYNASSPLGSPSIYVDYPYPVAVDGTIPVKLSFYTSTRTFPSPFAPGLTVETLPVSAVTSTNGSGVVPRIEILANRNVLLEFPSVAGRWYRVRYSPDMTNWFDSPVPIQASNNRMQWIDSGAPFTNIPPSQASSRFYRVNEIAAP